MAYVNCKQFSCDYCRFGECNKGSIEIDGDGECRSYSASKEEEAEARDEDPDNMF